MPVRVSWSRTFWFLKTPQPSRAYAAFCRDGKAERITITNVPSFADNLAAPLEVEGLGTLTVDTAYGQNERDRAERGSRKPINSCLTRTIRGPKAIASPTRGRSFDGLTLT